MNPFSKPCSLVAAVLFAGLGAVIAQSTNNPNRFTLGARVPFNLSVKFARHGGFPALSNPGPTAGGAIDRTYDDGYVGVDADNNAGGVTWFWGYRDEGQISGDTLRLGSSSADKAPTARAEDDQPALGFEAAWLRELHRSASYAVGFKLAFNLTDVSISDTRPLRAPVRLITDSYSLGGIIPPGGANGSGWQYQGTRDQGLYNEAPVIDDVPVSRDINPNAGTALTTGTRELDATVFGWKVGPWAEIPVTERVSFHAGGGLSWAVVDSRFRFRESTSIEGVGTTSLRGSDSDVGVEIGAYTEAGFYLDLTDRLGLFMLGEFQHLSDFEQTVSGRRATLDLGEAWSVQTGLSFSF